MVGTEPLCQKNSQTAISQTLRKWESGFDIEIWIIHALIPRPIHLYQLFCFHTLPDFFAWGMCIVQYWQIAIGVTFSEAFFEIKLIVILDAQIPKTSRKMFLVTLCWLAICPCPRSVFWFVSVTKLSHAQMLPAQQCLFLYKKISLIASKHPKNCLFNFGNEIAASDVSTQSM